MGIFGSKSRRHVTPIETNTSSNESSSRRSQILHNIYRNNKFIFIYVDANANESNAIYQNCLSRLQHIFISFHTFTNLKDFMKFLSTIKTEMIILVISNDFFEQIYSRLKSFTQIHSIYILSSDIEKKNISYQEDNKIQGVFTRIESICNFLQRNTKYFKQDSLTMSIIPSMKYTKNNLQQINQLFIYWMLVKQIILEIKYDNNNNALKSFTKFCRIQYFNNNIELININEFEKNYHKHSPIWWYTQKTFLFHMLNQGFQTQDIEIIIRMTFFIKDLYQQMDTLKTIKLPIITYRTQNILNSDFEKMKNIQGNLLSFNNFLITNSNYETSLNMAQKNNTEITVVFSIKIESNQPSSPYALLQNNSILFSMHCIFRIVHIQQIEDYLWKIDLLLTDSHDKQIINLTNLLRYETQESMNWFKLPQFISSIHDYEHAKDVYFSLLEYFISENDILKVGYIYNELGILYDQTCNYTLALSYYEKAIEIQQKYLPLNHRSLSISYNNMGEVQRQMGDYLNALSTHKKTLYMKQKILPENDLSFATTYNNIGLTNELLGEFSTALSFYEKAIEIKRKILPPNHQELATTYNNIGELQRAMGNFSIALINLEKALHIRLKKVSSTDSSLAIIYNNIGLIHQELGDFSKAILYLEKSLDVKLKHFPSNHPSLAFSYNNISTIHQQMGHFSQALRSYQIALDIQQKTLPSDHPDLAAIYNNIGVSYQSMKQHLTALDYYKKALAIQNKSLPSTHPDIATTYNSMATVLVNLGEYEHALKYEQHALDIANQTLASDHPHLVTFRDYYERINIKVKSMKNK
ncbi:unnamed protein product [Adineta steineri]|uniref:Kinesin light chain n=1 Tax=Adineta steineri TaxID=433720 RepID=A0A813TY17_9BILA|nr:unnamed protein product [Adineta steineri]